ncbi:MAG: YitT family protein [Bacteroidia bacterium]|nr:YitT family protein [Bacteroidia bacterium]
MPLTNKSVFTTVKEYAMITLGILMYVIGWTIVLIPNNLVAGGVTGVGSIVQYATNGAVKIGYTYLAVNSILMVIALFTLGKSFGFKTVFAIMLVSLGLNIFQDIIPAEICRTLAVENGKLMSVIMGGIMSGVGIGFAISAGGSTGGTDIVALVVNKYRGVSPGRMMLCMDVVIILSSMLVPSYTQSGELLPFTEKITTVVYGLILIALTSTVLDMFLQGSKQSVQLFILSKKYEEIANLITGDLHRGVTVLDGQGWYTKQPTKVLMVLTRKTDLNIMLRYIKSIDPNAFLSVSTVTGVYGCGFETIKQSKALKRTDKA